MSGKIWRYVSVYCIIKLTKLRNLLIKHLKNRPDIAAMLKASN
jgi:hypothetical protein